MIDSINDILSSLESEDKNKQVYGLNSLDSNSCSEMISHLIGFLHSTNEDIKIIAIEKIRQCTIDKKDIICPHLLNMKNDPSSLIRSDAIDALADFEYLPALKTIQIIMSNDADWLVRVSAIEAFVSISIAHDSKNLQEITRVTRDEDATVRSYAYWAIGILGMQGEIGYLKERYIHEKAIDVRADMLIALFRLGCRESLIKLLNILEESDECLIQIILNMMEDLIPDMPHKNTLEFKEDAIKIKRSMNKIMPTLTYTLNQAESLLKNIN